jgi:heme exporter protein B
LAGVSGTRALFDGASFAELGDYLALMGIFAVVFVAGGLSLFDAMLEG